MIVKELTKLLRNICKNHAEAKNADVWFYGGDAHTSYPVKNIGYDQKHKPNRLKLEP